MFKSLTQVQQKKFSQVLQHNIEAYNNNAPFKPLKVDFYTSLNAFSVSIDCGQLRYTLETQKEEIRLFKTIPAILKAFPILEEIDTPYIELAIA